MPNKNLYNRNSMMIIGDSGKEIKKRLFAIQKQLANSNNTNNSNNLVIITFEISTANPTRIINIPAGHIIDRLMLNYFSGTYPGAYNITMQDNSYNNHILYTNFDGTANLNIQLDYISFNINNGYNTTLTLTTNMGNIHMHGFLWLTRLF